MLLCMSSCQTIKHDSKCNIHYTKQLKSISGGAKNVLVIDSFSLKTEKRYLTQIEINNIIIILT